MQKAIAMGGKGVISGSISAGAYHFFFEYKSWSKSIIMMPIIYLIHYSALFLSIVMKCSVQSWVPFNQAGVKVAPFLVVYSLLSLKPICAVNI